MSDHSDIDWSELRCGTGPATAVPSLLERAQDDDARRRGAARRDLAGTFRTRGGLPWSAAPHTVARLLPMWCGTDETDRAARMRLTIDVAFGDCDEYAAFGFHADHANLPWLLRTQQPLAPSAHRALDAHRHARCLMLDAMEHWLAALGSDDLDVRTSAAFALPLLVERAPDAIDALRAAASIETEPRAAAATLVALGLLRAESLPQTQVEDPVVDLARAMAKALCHGLSDELEARLEACMSEHEPAARMNGWPWLDGALRQHAELVLFHTSFERDDIDRHDALVARHPRLAALGAGLRLLIELRRGRRQYRRVAAHELNAAKRDAIEQAVASDTPSAMLEGVGIFAAQDTRAEQLDADHPLASRHDDEPLWRTLSDAADDVRPVDDWIRALAATDDPVGILLGAASGPFRLYRQGAQDGIREGDARWDALNEVLRQSIDQLELFEPLTERATQYGIDEGINRGLFLLEVGRERGTDPGDDWVRHVAAEVEKKWAAGPRIEALKAWAANR